MAMPRRWRRLIPGQFPGPQTDALGSRPRSLAAVFGLQFGFAFVGPNCRARFESLRHLVLQSGWVQAILPEALRLSVDNQHQPARAAPPEPAYRFREIGGRVR